MKPETLVLKELIDCIIELRNEKSNCLVADLPTYERTKKCFAKACKIIQEQTESPYRDWLEWYDKFLDD